MKRELATAIVEAWKTDAPVVAVPGLREYLMGKKAPFATRVRVLVAAGNYSANEALWIADFKTAITWLIRRGLRSRERSYSYYTLATSNLRRAEERVSNIRRSGERKFEKAKRSSWSTIKPVRSRG